MSFEKQHGDREEIEDVVIEKRRNQYEAAIAENQRNYDVWSPPRSQSAPKGRSHWKGPRRLTLSVARCRAHSQRRRRLADC